MTKPAENEPTVLNEPTRASVVTGSVESKYTEPIEPSEYVARSIGVVPWEPPMQLNPDYTQQVGITGDPDLVIRLGVVRRELSALAVVRHQGHPMDMVPGHVEFPGIL